VGVRSCLRRIARFIKAVLRAGLVAAALLVLRFLGKGREEPASRSGPETTPPEEPHRVPHGPEAPGVTGKLQVLGRRIALGMVLLATLSALAAWRASDFDESASQDTAVYWQEVDQRAATERLDQDAVNEDVRNFSDYEQYELLGSALRQAATQPGQTNLAAELFEAQSEEELRQARLALAQFSVSQPVIGSNPGEDSQTLSYPVAGAYQRLLAQDRQNTRLRPDEERQLALTGEQRSVYLTGVAAAFIAALVLLTIASVSIRTAPSTGELAVQTSAGRRLTARNALISSAILLGVVASALFIVVIGSG
jgi:hypothetical protein